MFFNKKSFLKSEITRLANEGLISKAQEKEILNFYSLDKGSDFPFLVVFAFIFIGLSLLTLVAYNWEQIPNIVKTLLLLATLFATHLGIFYSNNPLFKQSFGILSGFVLLANIALLSQIYHLGEDTTSAFLSVGCVVLALAFALKSSAIFLVGYLFTSVWYVLNLVEYYHSMSLFICIIALGIIVQSGILFPLSLNAKKILALPNFIFLGLYLCEIREESLNLSAFAWLSLIILGFHFQSYKIYAYFALALILIASSYYPLEDLFFGQIDIWLHLLKFVKHILDNCHSWIEFCFLTITGFMVQILSAFFTNTCTVFPAQNLHGPVNQNLIVDYSI